MGESARILAGLLALVLVPAAAEAKARFEKQDIGVPGHILWLDWGDLDADGAVDLVVSYRRGLGPEAQRFLAVFFRSERGFASRPDLMLVAPTGSAIFDVGDALPSAGEEIVYLTRFGVFAQSLSGRRPAPPVSILRTRTILGAPEEEDLVRWDFLRPLVAKGPEHLVIPTRASLEIHRREPTANAAWKRIARIAIPQHSFYDAESQTFKQGRRGGAGGRPFSLRVTTIVPTLTFADQTGDGQPDLITTFEDRVAVYPMRADGTLSSTASFQRWLQLLTPDEQASRDTEISLDVVDVDGDGIADVSASKIGGGITNIHSETRIYGGIKGGGLTNAPLQVFKDDGFAVLVRYTDLDGDGKVEMVHPYVTVSLLAMSQVFVTGKFGLDLRIRRASAGNGRVFAPSPAQTIETVFGLDFSTGGGMRGMAPIHGIDFDRDGRPDLMLSQGAERMELHRGQPGDEPFDDDAALTITAPISRETYAVPRHASGAPGTDIVIAYVDHPKLVGKLTVLLDKSE
ncbi:MAG: VCBS repeat-containing protein [Deltaproteobacteria bacterium]|nr:VCBS repeat-containing protein [Deltaproteobacteria bacterium]